MINVDVSGFESGRSGIEKLFRLMSGEATEAEIFISSNSPGAAYAEKIHDGRGDSWENLGPRSERKGATDLFIEHAITDLTPLISSTIDNGIAGLLTRKGTLTSAMRSIAIKVQRLAKQYCPESPTKGEYKRLVLKTVKGRKNSVFQATTGGLRNSIEYEVR